LFTQQIGDAAKDRSVLGKKRPDLAAEKINNGLRHDLQG
jgi:hypothetical protein